MKKIILPLLVLLLIQLSLISAINLDVDKETVKSSAIIELNEPAVFNLKITNLDQEDTFQIYSLVGIEIEPKEPFTIGNNEVKEIQFKVYPKNSPEFLSFEYKIKDSKGNVQKEDVALRIINLKDAFNVYADSISPDSSTATITFENKEDHEFEDLEVSFSSVFFEKTQTMSLDGNEKKQIDIIIDKEKAEVITAGEYFIDVDLTLDALTVSKKATIKFTEKSGLETNEYNEGFLLNRYEIEKINLGNVRTKAEVKINKNLISSLFTTFNIPYTRKEVSGLGVMFVFQKNLSPGDSLNVVVRTNWWLFIIIIIAAVLIIYFGKKFASTKLVVKKKTSYVKTRGGEFALKVSLIVRAKSYVENIKISDKLPGMVKIYERYGAIKPDKIDERNRRMEWNLGNLDAGEERILSYIVYSKIGIIGTFELPSASATYEYQGQIKDSNSNKSFFVNEPASND